MFRSRFMCLAVIVLSLSSVAWAQEGKKQLTVDEIFDSQKFRTQTLQGTQWLPNGRQLSYFETEQGSRQRNLYVRDAATGKREKVMDASLLRGAHGQEPMQVASYQWSVDGKELLLTGRLPVRRSKSGGNFGLFTPATKQFRMLTDTTAEQAIIKLSPDGKRVGFVRGNNIFIIDVATGKETRLTADGSETIINGKFDWVYEEEFSIIDGWQWSPDGKYIAFWRLDQSREPSFPLVRYSRDDAHAEIETMRYPKAGDPNATVKIGVVDISSGATRWLDLGPNPDVYIPRIQWTADPSILSVQRLNRGQDTLDLFLANMRDGSMRQVLREVDTAWIDIYDDLTFLSKSNDFLWTSYRDGYKHIYLYGADGTLRRQLTKGPWEVDKIAGVDQKRGIVYFVASKSTPLERHLYHVSLDGRDLEQISTEPGTHRVSMAPGCDYYTDTYSNIHTPPILTIRKSNGDATVTLVKNTLDSLAGYALGEEKFFTFKTADGVELNGWMITPPDFTPGKRYPVLMYVYGLAGSQTVQNNWGTSNYLWYQMLAERGYIIVSVDGRGTGGRGKAFMQLSHRRFGIPEVQDQIQAARYLAALPYVDASRIGIWGWSGGGFMTCLAMTLGADVFKTGIAVASVTDWRYYDTIYTERYMDTPARNPEGYKETAPVTHADKLKGNLLIVHGTTDDNVHWQNDIVFVNELIHFNKQIRTMYYPGRNHGISGDNATRHLYTMMTDYIMEKL